MTKHKIALAVLTAATVAAVALANGVVKVNGSETPSECPADTELGSYHLQGYAKDSNHPICGFTYYNECPHYAAVSADDPACYKNQPVEETEEQEIAEYVPIENGPNAYECEDTQSE